MSSVRYMLTVILRVHATDRCTPLSRSLTCDDSYATERAALAANYTKVMQYHTQRFRIDAYS